MIPNLAIAAALFVAGLRLFAAPTSVPNLTFAAALLFLVAALITVPGGSS